MRGGDVVAQKPPRMGPAKFTPAATTVPKYMATSSNPGNASARSATQAKAQKKADAVYTPELEARDTELGDPDVAADRYADIISSAVDGNLLGRSDTTWIKARGPHATALYEKAVAKGQKLKQIVEDNRIKLQNAGNNPLALLGGVGRSTKEEYEKNIADTRDEIAEGLGTADDYQRVWMHDHPRDTGLGEQLKSIGNLFVDNDVFHALKEGVHTIASNDIANYTVGNPLVGAVPVVGEPLAAAWDVLQGADAVLGLIPDHIETDGDRLKREKEAVGAAHRDYNQEILKQNRAEFGTGVRRFGLCKHR